MSTTLSDTVFSQITYVEIIVYVVVTIIIAQLWVRAYNNLLFETFGLSETLVFASLILAIATTIITLILLFNYPLLIKGIRN